MWAAIENGTYAHIYTKLDSPYKMMGQLISWSSICSIYGRYNVDTWVENSPLKIRRI